MQAALICIEIILQWQIVLQGSFWDVAACRDGGNIIVMTVSQQKNLTLDNSPQPTVLDALSQ